MAVKIPILLSFYALTNGSTTSLFGQLTYTPIKDFSFKDYSKRKTFRTLFRLYQTRPYANQELILVFTHGQVKISTNSYGGFYEKDVKGISAGYLERVLLPSGEEVRMIDGLYGKMIHHFNASSIVVSDIDDTLVHSFIYKKLRKFKTLMFTTMEKRKAVDNMKEIIKYFTNAGSEPVYLSNSEQNLYPIIYRFLHHNGFPAGPLFLKQMRSLWDVIWNIKFPLRNMHKVSSLENLLAMFPDKKFILMGDNTQQDLSTYLDISYRFPNNIRYVIIRKVVDKANDLKVVDQAMKELDTQKIKLYYSDSFPSTFDL